MTPPEPRPEHQWLHRLVGEWTAESEMSAGPDQPAEKFISTESVRSVGGLWVICENRGTMPGGGEATGIITLGFDPERGRFVGTFIGSMMTYQWVYDGQFDAAGKVLTLDTVGPNFDAANKLTKYQERLEFLSPDHRTFTSHMLGEDGAWVQIVKMDYRRKR